MRQQQNDPIAQAMQILQLVTQRRGQQADIEQGGRRLDLQEQQLQQGNEQFNQGLQWDQEQFGQKSQQLDRDMMLRELVQKQSAEQFNQGLQWDQTKIGQKNEQWKAEQEQERIQQIVENTRYNMAQPTDQAYKQMLVDKARREMSGQIQDPRMTLAQLEEDKMIVTALQEQLNLAPQMEQGRLRDQIQAYLAQRYKDKLPPLRDYNQMELNAQRMFQTPQQ